MPLSSKVVLVKIKYGNIWIIFNKRTKKGLNQSEFGLERDIIMTDISKIENRRKIFPLQNFEKLAKVIG